MKKKSVTSSLLVLGSVFVLTVTLAAMFCFGVLSVGKATAAEAVTTWSDGTNTYTFDCDINGDYSEDIGNLATDYRYSTENGFVKGTGPRWNNSDYYGAFFFNNQEARVGETGGISFAFKVDGAWDAGLANGPAVELTYGDLYLDFQGNANGNLIIYATSRQQSGNNSLGYYVFGNVFKASGSSYEMTDFVTVKINRVKCTNATGYLLNLSVNGNVSYDAVSSLKTTTFVPYAMTSGLDVSKMISLNNATAAVDSGNCNIAVRRGDGAVLLAENYDDIVDLSNDASFQKSVLLEKGLPEQSKWDDPTSIGVVSDKLGGNYGLEFRFVPSSTTRQDVDFMTVKLGSFNINFGMSTQNGDYDGLILGAWSTGGNNNLITAYGPTAAGSFYFGAKPYSIDGTASKFEYGKEYAVRLTKISKLSNGSSTPYTYVSLYMGEIDQTTGKPCVNWAEIPVVRYVDKNAYNENANVVGVVNANDNADSVSVGSNKSVGALTVVDGKETLATYSYGDTWTTQSATTASMVSFGWTKNYDKPYSEADYVADGAEITMTAPVELTAITLKIAADNKAKIRLLPTEVGGYEVALKWQVDVDDTDIYYLKEYYGDKFEISFGCRLTANGKSKEVTVQNFDKNNDFSVIQAGITADNGSVTFALVPYVVINGQKVSCLDTAAEYTSVNALAGEAIADTKDTADDLYKYEVENGKYSYLTKDLYDIIKSACGTVKEA